MTNYGPEGSRKTGTRVLGVDLDGQSVSSHVCACLSLERVRLHEDVLCPPASHAKLRELEEGVSEEYWRRGSDNVAAARRPAWKQHLREEHRRRRFQTNLGERDRRKGWRGKGIR